MEHTLETDEKIVPKKQKLRKMSEETAKQLKMKCKVYKTQMRLEK
jgi:hypothetical protein